MEDVEVAGSVAHLDKEAPGSIPNAEHAFVDPHLGSTFIELAKSHDGVAQRRDEVDTVVDAVFPWNMIGQTP